MILTVITLLCILAQTDGHGRLLHPAGRSTMWRFGFKTERNSNDHQLSCGGFGVQFYTNNGKCGLCGDPYHAPVPRDNEAGGKYGKGLIAQTFKQGDVIPVTIEITVNHGGWSEFKVCPVNDPKKRTSEECFDQYKLKTVEGQDRVPVTPGLGPKTYHLQLPKDLSCSQCVLRWRWNTASNVACQGGQCCRGCGNQEQFYGCSDITITPDNQSGGISNQGQHLIHQQLTTKSPVVVINNNNNNNPVQHPSAGSSQVGQFPGGSNNAGNFPGSFVPITAPVSGNVAPSGGMQVGGNVNNNNNNNQFPAGFIGVPVGNGPDFEIKCQATEQLTNKINNGDQWCVTNCKQGYCPGDLCTRECMTFLPTKPMEVCKATALLREKRPDADTWCRQACAMGFCPTIYCDASCKS